MRSIQFSLQILNSFNLNFLGILRKPLEIDYLLGIKNSVVKSNQEITKFTAGWCGDSIIL